ncbi:MAG: ATP-binding protein [Gammaproteobacteria bacterium]|nr:ATP-binding protein [Gammaproteobacteria bacterium]
MKTGELIFFCGKMGAGKSTESMVIAQVKNAVLLSEDEWLESLYPNKVRSLDDYINYSSLIKPQIKKLVQSILKTGTDVVMDFPANTITQREWFKGIFSEIDAAHTIVYIDVPNTVCLERITKRRAEQPERAATDTVEIFEAVTKYFVAPEEHEGFNIRSVTQNV